ncbi:hypothetical protein K505DRAFT_339127 [Melanomma pulvis-pyrius CBS 109.77]|uniref:Uncharacterized protein n=1 Tax=Melanomma pulvis-pyrius CBS 109.77 TaxID=1314802 RepID=A0A6A6X758_9PLEO|nr:hypothetical protein K505DRAFT_339127 [Melanomma pulvis-pyrius CBS 109.77]
MNPPTMAEQITLSSVSITALPGRRRAAAPAARRPPLATRNLAETPAASVDKRSYARKRKATTSPMTNSEVNKRLRLSNTPEDTTFTDSTQELNTVQPINRTFSTKLKVNLKNNTVTVIPLPEIPPHHDIEASKFDKTSRKQDSASQEKESKGSKTNIPEGKHSTTEEDMPEYPPSRYTDPETARNFPARHKTVSIMQLTTQLDGPDDGLTDHQMLWRNWRRDEREGKVELWEGEDSDYGP